MLKVVALSSLCFYFKLFIFSEQKPTFLKNLDALQLNNETKLVFAIGESELDTSSFTLATHMCNATAEKRKSIRESIWSCSGTSNLKHTKGS